MKAFPGSARPTKCQTTQRRVFCLLLLAGAAIFIAGCGKTSASATKPSDAENTQATNQTDQTQAPAATRNQAPANPQTPTAPPAVTATGEPDLTAINRVMLRFVVSHHHKPANFQEFAAFAASVNFTIPSPPPGKKYAIDKSGIHVDLVNQ